MSLSELINRICFHHRRRVHLGRGGGVFAFCRNEKRVHPNFRVIEMKFHFCPLPGLAFPM